MPVVPPFSFSVNIFMKFFCMYTMRDCSINPINFVFSRRLLHSFSMFFLTVFYEMQLLRPDLLHSSFVLCQSYAIVILLLS